jgi:hypothetical protein
MSFGYEPENVRARFDCISSWGANVKPAVVIAGNLFGGLAYIENGSENSVQNEERQRKNSLVPKERPRSSRGHSSETRALLSSPCRCSDNPNGIFVPYLEYQPFP